MTARISFGFGNAIGALSMSIVSLSQRRHVDALRARLLYADLIERASAAGHEMLVCEVNCEPPNPASDAFHAAVGFTEVARAAIHRGSKVVRYLARSIGPE